MMDERWFISAVQRDDMGPERHVEIGVRCLNLGCARQSIEVTAAPAKQPFARSCQFLNIAVAARRYNDVLHQSLFGMPSKKGDRTIAGARACQ